MTNRAFEPCHGASGRVDDASSSGPIAQCNSALDAALRAAAGLVKLLGFRRDCVTAASDAEQAQATAKLTEAGAELTAAAEAVTGLLELARITAAAGRTGKQNLN